MPFKRYTEAQRQEAVSLSKVIGAEAAAQQLGMDWRAVRRWAEKAGEAPEVTADRGAWARLMDLSIARATALVASGKLSPTAITTVAGIAARNVQYDPKPKPPADVEPVTQWVDSIESAFPEWRPDLVARHDGDAVSAFIEGIAYFLRVEPPVDLEDWLKTYDPVEAQAQYEAEQAAFRADAQRRRDEARAAYAATLSQPVDPETAALIEEAERYLHENAS